MNKKTAPRVQLNFAPEVEEPEKEQSDDESLPVEVPQVIERDEIVENDIFDNPSLNDIVSEAKEDLIINEIQDAEPQAEKSEKPVKKKAPPKGQTQKKKRQLSEEHKAKLALAREKALATRRAKAEEKKKMKEIETKTKELKKKKAQKDLEELEDEVETKSKPKQIPVNHGSTNYPTSMLTRKDLEEAQFEAIMKYETIRKARKEEKKKQQMIEQQKKDLQKKIQGYGARDSNGRLLNKWDRCY